MLEFEREALVIAWNSVKERKVRSFLTVLGIAIGIAAIISLVSIGEGLRVAIMRQVEQFGANKIIVMPFAEIAGPRVSLGTSYFTQKDVERVERVRGVDVVAPFLIKTLEVDFKGEKRFTMVTGIEPEKSKRMFEDVQGYRLESGRFFRKNEGSSAILGNAVAHDMFTKEVNIGDKLEISGEKFKVVGIFKEIGNRVDDNMIVVPMDKLRELTGDKEVVTMILVGAKANDVSSVAERIRDTLEKYHERGTFTVLTSQQLAERLRMISLTLTIFLGGIATISLVVAGIGIANTMLMTVMERTREIGIMKAIGAKNVDIMKIFLIESVLLSFVGGLFGCFLGVAGSKGLSKYSFSTGVTLRTAVTPSLLLFGLVFSIVVGVLFGLWPAYRAAKLSPVEALRYE